jgi:hypothetical protein
MAGLLYEDGLEPCPGSCAVDISEFEVDDIPGVQGVARITTAEDLEATGEQGDPFTAYKITFADGPFAYEVDMHGPPDKVSQEQVEEIAKNLYERVEGSVHPRGSNRVLASCATLRSWKGQLPQRKSERTREPPYESRPGLTAVRGQANMGPLI